MPSMLRAALSVVPFPRPSTLPEDTLTTTAVVDRAHLARYQRVCGFRLSDRLPVTYPHILGFGLQLDLMTRRDFPFPVVGGVHVANRIEQTRPLTADDVLELAVHARDLRDHPRGRQYDVITTASVDGTVVWRDVSTYLRRGPSAEPREERPAREPAPEAPPHATWRVPTSTGTEYADASGDHNPIHTSWLGARLFGFPRPIAHGMWSKARCLAALEGRLPDAYTVDVAFKLPMLLPATVGFTWTGDEFSLRDARSGKPYLAGTVSR
ncbi:MaoC/PaaZ C-terminal domain-containing protein [Catellatospora sp. IY07-71]|uniref:MaoC family dehydratase n=1 Tax=Catellatospora sp. IY07-71 TaxID=2728827 RepID=UPI001BB3C733|nr:MaoC/PaaZ C-terminal domain-containing protein [Catellatospora sp. IY07-71]